MTANHVDKPEEVLLTSLVGEASSFPYGGGGLAIFPSHIIQVQQGAWLKKNICSMEIASPKPYTGGFHCNISAPIQGCLETLGMEAICQRVFSEDHRERRFGKGKQRGTLL